MPSKKKRLKEYEERIEQAKSVLSLISEDRTTPRNIRRAAKEAIKILTVGDQTQAVKSAQAISLLDDISQDTNMPAYTRTRIWNVVSILAVIKE
ncbi:MAG: UPF0147 family protein [Candidatus Bathyarchaeota archaeon]|nr:MAG: UPF0147 family protein [Candidatus Bathyarchaeota archaeon]